MFMCKYIFASVIFWYCISSNTNIFLADIRTTMVNLQHAFPNIYLCVCEKVN